MHAAEFVIGAVPGKCGKDLYPHPLEIVDHDFRVALDVVVADIIDHIFASDFRLDRSDLLIDPGDIDLVMAS